MQEMQEMTEVILRLGAGAMVHREQAGTIAARMLSGARTRDTMLEAVVAEDPVRWIPMATAERMADACLRLFAGTPGVGGAKPISAPVAPCPI